MAVAWVAVDERAAVMVAAIPLAAVQRGRRGGGGRRPVAFLRQREALRQQGGAARGLRRGRRAQQVPALLRGHGVVWQVVALAGAAVSVGHEIQEAHAQHQAQTKQEDVDRHDLAVPGRRHRPSGGGVFQSQLILCSPARGGISDAGSPLLQDKIPHC